MKKWIVLVLLALAGVASWYIWETRKKPKDETPQLQPVAVSQYSDSFNISLNNVLQSYYTLTEAFVNWDSAAVTTEANKLKTNLEAVNLAELKQNTDIHQTALSFIDGAGSELQTIIQSSPLVERRGALNRLTDNLYNLLRTVRYDAAKVYLQECPMAFNDTDPGIWLSKTDAIRNPYLGLHHPKYGKGMLECGDNKDTLNYTKQQ